MVSFDIDLTIFIYEKVEIIDRPDRPASENVFQADWAVKTVPVCDSVCYFTSKMC